VVTIEELSTRTRAEVVAVEGVGPRTMALLDAALSLEGLDYTPAAR
jgi:hypothetical protein